MFGKLFGKKQAGASAEERREKLSRPMDILQPVGQSLVITYKLNPDWVWSLKTVTRSYTDAPHRVEFRAYDPQEVSTIGLAVKNFYTLDQHHDMILYSGWVDKKTKEMELIDHRTDSKKTI